MEVRYNYRVIITVLVFLFIFSIRLPYLTNSPAEMGDMWRQPDTESIARNFVEHRFNILYPQFNYDGPLPNVVQLEFQVTTFITAILYKIFGYSYAIARLVPIAFFMLSAWYLYLLAKRLYNREAAWLGVLIYGIMPINIFYSRAIMPESALLFFFIAAFYYFALWIHEERDYQLILSSIFTALAISQKTPAIFIGLAMLFMIIGKYGLGFIKRGRLWLFGLLALLPPLIYIKWSESVSQFTFVSGIAVKHILPKFLTAPLSSAAWSYFNEAFPAMFTLGVLILALIGVLSIRSKKELPAIYLTIAMLIEVIIIVSVIKFDYYLILLTPSLALLSGKALSLLFKRGKIGAVVTVVLLAYILNTGWTTIKPKYEVIYDIVHFAEFVNENTNEEDLIVVGTLDPARLSLSSRRGWRGNIKYYDYIPKDIPGELNYYIENKGTYFVVFNNYIYNDDGSYLTYLNNNFEKKDFNNGYVFYMLQNRINNN